MTNVIFVNDKTNLPAFLYIQSQLSDSVNVSLPQPTRDIHNGPNNFSPPPPPPSPPFEPPHRVMANRLHHQNPPYVSNRPERVQNHSTDALNYMGNGKAIFNFGNDRGLNGHPLPNMPPPDIGNHSGGSQTARRKRSSYTKDQLNILEKEFAIGPFINKTRRKELSTELNIPEKQIMIWFQNRRMKKNKDLRPPTE
ncbi:Homeobox protein Hox-B13a [Thelohanellus kitauei]|uniref:Homeobox protein Hox-B13a n=1 Tax=Thelohanellus kitauei TaxID=669202 RepID=A0A0C2N0Z2_THEKT|nr:Homeobox protein Hox-B13a [Thelohanellus kitauei]